MFAFVRSRFSALRPFFGSDGVRRRSWHDRPGAAGGKSGPGGLSTAAGAALGCGLLVVGALWLGALGNLEVEDLPAHRLMLASAERGQSAVGEEPADLVTRGQPATATELDGSPLPKPRPEYSPADEAVARAAPLTSRLPPRRAAPPLLGPEPVRPDLPQEAISHLSQASTLPDGDLASPAADARPASAASLPLLEGTSGSEPAPDSARRSPDPPARHASPSDEIARASAGGKAAPDVPSLLNPPPRALSVSVLDPDWSLGPPGPSLDMLERNDQVAMAVDEFDGADREALEPWQPSAPTDGTAHLEAVLSFEDGEMEQVLELDGCDASLTVTTLDPSSRAPVQEVNSQFDLRRFHLLEAESRTLLMAADSDADDDLLLYYKALAEGPGEDESAWMEQLLLKLKGGEFGEFLAENRRETRMPGEEDHTPLVAPLVEVALQLPDDASIEARAVFRSYMHEHCSKN